MGKLVVSGTRFLLLGALLLLLPSLAAAQCPSAITVQLVSTQDAGGKAKTTFAPGETIQFAALVSSNYGGSGQTSLAITTSFYNDTKTVNIPLGSSTWTWNATAPSTPGNYTVTIQLIDPFCGVWVGASASFTIGQSSGFSFDVASTSGWQPTSLKVTTGQELSFSASGSWTVDYRNFPYVGPDGYSPQVDSTIYQGCKLDSVHPYGVLLVRIGADDPTPFMAIGSKAEFPAYRDGFLEFRIHDADACLVDNAGIVTVTVEERDNLPLPKAWGGKICDTTQYSGSSPLGTYYRGTPACGPRPGPPPDACDLPCRDVATISYVAGAIGELEWECVELSMRFMYLAYGIPPYNAPTGDLVVDNYPGKNSILQKTANNQTGVPGPLPVPGDILSYNDPVSPHHTSVVIATNVDGSGKGTIDVIEQNFHPKGTATLNVNSWHVNGIKNWLHHTVDLFPQSGPPLTNIIVRGTSFGANEIVMINFNTTPVGTTTTDSTGAFSTMITIPSSAPLDSNNIQSIGQTSGFSPTTVFYVQ
jgi:hypothetical protein